MDLSFKTVTKMRLGKFTRDSKVEVTQRHTHSQILSGKGSRYFKHFCAVATIVVQSKV